MNRYNVEIDGIESTICADSLAALANLVRGKGKRIKVWSSVGIMLIDTQYGDAYDLIKEEQ